MNDVAGGFLVKNAREPFSLRVGSGEVIQRQLLAPASPGTVQAAPLARLAKLSSPSKHPSRGGLEDYT